MTLVEHPNALRAVLESSREQQSGQVAKIERQLEELDALMADRKKASAGIANALAAEYSQVRPNELTIAALRQQADDLQRAVEQIQERRLPLLAQLDEKVVSQRYIEDVVAYAESIHDQIPVAGFELQREIIDRLNFRFEFEIRAETTAMIYLQWYCSTETRHAYNALWAGLSSPVW
jgi:chromosome segregation ATPase